MLTDRTAASENQRTEGEITSGTVLRGRFVLEEQLEHGRLGVVFRASDRQRSREDGAGQPVEILILPAEITRNRTQLETFKREFASVQALSHPNIVDLYDFDRDGETYYIVMEWVDGESLRNVVDSLAPELLSERESLEVVRAVGEALLYAHASGIVHGDVRAENVLVTSHHEIKLLFASACLARSAPFSVDPRDDVYGLASLAYQLLSGEMPPATGLQGAAGRHRTGEPPRIKSLSRGRWNTLRAGLAVRDKRMRSVRQFLGGIGVPERELPKEPRRAVSTDSGLGLRILRRAAVAVIVMGAVVAVVFGALQLGANRLAELPALATGPGEAADTSAAGTDAQTPAEESTAPFEARLPQVSDAVPEAAIVTPSDRAGALPPDAIETDATRSAVESETTLSSLSEAPLAGEVDAPREGEVDAPVAGEVEAAPAEEVNPSSEQRIGTEEETTAAASADAPSAAVVPRATDVSPVEETPSAQAGTSQEAPLAFARREIVVSEGQSVVAIEIIRSDAGGSMSAVWWTSDGTAVATDDYADFGRVVERFAAGERSRTVLVPITSDALVEDAEYFNVNLSALSAAGSQQGQLLTATVTIVDDD